jgi:SAM-dependent methyltransferase
MGGKSAVTPLRKWAAQQMKGKVLDIGSGKGVYKSLLGGSEILRLDINRQYLEGDWGIRLVGNAVHLPFAESTLDGVWACAVVEHIVEDTIPEFVRVTKPGGQISILTPNKNSPKDFMRRLIGRKTWIQHGGHVRLYTVNDLRKYGTVYGEIWGLPFLDPLLRFVPQLGDTILLHFTVTKQN